LATFNGFHIFLSHIAVHEKYQGLSIARQLHDELMTHALRLGAKGIIVHSWLRTTGFYYKLGYGIPGAVFLINRLERAQ
jgi:GNAT superfamily N-acetyltransferase